MCDYLTKANVEKGKCWIKESVHFISLCILLIIWNFLWRNMEEDSELFVLNEQPVVLFTEKN